MEQNSISIFRLVIIVIFSYGSISNVNAQKKKDLVITGTVIDMQTKNPVLFASIALYQISDSTLANGAVSTPNGEFHINPVLPGEYFVQVSAVGYKSEEIHLLVEKEIPVGLGVIYLHEENTELQEVVVTGERIKARNEVDKTTFFVNKKMLDASNTGTDLLKFIPGIQVDFMQNINLQGNGNIVILINGMERDPKFIQKLNPENIDRIEVMTNPPAKFEGAAGGVINMILKKDQQAGLDGQVYLELPSSSSEVYIFPTYNFSYGVGKVDFFTSYSGDFRYFNIEESYYRKFYAPVNISEIVSSQYVRQKNWSHRFQYGLDYFPDKKNQLNFYAYYNPYSKEQDGATALQAKGEVSVSWERKKEDDDINHDAFYSLYYKHLFEANSGHELAVDASLYRMRAENTTRFTEENSDEELINKIMPLQNSFSLKVDYNLPVNHQFIIAVGVQNKVQELEDRNTNDFSHQAKIYAAYGSVRFVSDKIELAPGLRVENSYSEIRRAYKHDFFISLPNLAVHYKPGSRETLKLTYRRAVVYPGFHQLNPYVTMDDPYTKRSGNLTLKPIQLDNLSVEYSHSLSQGWFSTNVFLRKKTDVINHMTWLLERDVAEIRTFNLGNIYEFGFLVSGSFNLGKVVTLQPHFKAFRIFSAGNSHAKQQNIEDRWKYAFESGLSVSAFLKHDFTATARFMYNSPVNEIQWIHFSDPLYFFALGKSLSKRFKVEITTALPFKKLFTYKGAEVNTEDFYQITKADIQLSLVPFTFSFRHQSSAGVKRKKINRSIQNMKAVPVPIKGF